MSFQLHIRVRTFLPNIRTFEWMRHAEQTEQSNDRIFPVKTVSHWQLLETQVCIGYAIIVTNMFLQRDS